MIKLKIGATIYVVVLFTLIALLFVSRLIWPSIFAPGPNVKTVTVREGLTAVEISKLLQDEGIFVRGETLPQELDGYLFPDTYEFFVPSSLDFVVNKFSDNFNQKVLSNASLKSGDLKDVLTVASLVEDEAVNPADRKIIAGIIWKRLKSGQKLEIDSSICYIKPPPCWPVTKDDLATDSHYNTYLYKGLPPGPISNPGLDSIAAALNPQDTKYWFYISDPKTKNAVFASTLEEQDAHIAKYLN